MTNVWYAKHILWLWWKDVFANFTSPKSRIALQVAWKMAPCDRAFKLSQILLQNWPDYTSIRSSSELYCKLLDKHTSKNLKRLTGSLGSSHAYCTVYHFSAEIWNKQNRKEISVLKRNISLRAKKTREPTPPSPPTPPSGKRKFKKIGGGGYL